MCSNTSQTFPKSCQILRTQDRSISRKDSCEIHWRMYIKLTSLKFNAKWWTETMNRTENLTSWGLTFHTCYTISIAVNKSGFQNLYWSRRKFLERKRSLLRCSPDELIKLLIDASLNIICCVITDYVNWKRATFEWREFLRKLSAAWTHSVQNNNQSMNWWSCIVIPLDSIRGEHSTKFSTEVFVPLHHSNPISHRKLSKTPFSPLKILFQFIVYRASFETSVSISSRIFAQREYKSFKRLPVAWGHLKDEKTSQW